MSMLSVKHVEKSGHESIIQCHSVQFYPKVDGDATTSPRLEVFGCTGDGGAVFEGHATFGNGKLYVMNDAGSTVGTYDLD